MSTETVKIGDTEHVIETKPLTMLFKSPAILDKIDYPDRIRIEPDHTIYHAERVQQFHPRTAGLVAKILKIKDPSQVDPDWCRTKTREVLHVAGLVDMALKFAVKGVPVVFIQPEAGLHPRQQVELGDFFLELMKDPEPSTQDTMVDTILEEE